MSNTTNNQQPANARACEVFSQGEWVLYPLALAEEAIERGWQVRYLVPQSVGPLARRRVFDYIREAYDLGYNDARNAKAVPGDGAPGYKGRDVEADHGGALLHALEALGAQTTQQAAEPVAPVRSDAVNLARNMLEVRDCKGITSYGVRVLCEAVMQMHKRSMQQAAEPVGVTSEQRRLIRVIADKIEDGTLFQAGIYSRKDLARFVRNMLDTQPQAAEPVAATAAMKDAVFEESIAFIETLTGMQPPPIEVAPPEVFAPFRDFTEKVCLIFAQQPAPTQQPLTSWQRRQIIMSVKTVGEAIDMVEAIHNITRPGTHASAIAAAAQALIDHQAAQALGKEGGAA